MEKWSKERKELWGGGDIKASNLPQNHSASMQLASAQNVKGAGFQCGFLLSCFPFIIPPDFQASKADYLYSHKTISCIPFQHFCLFRGYETGFFQSFVFHHTYHTGKKTTSLVRLLWDHKDLLAIYNLKIYYCTKGIYVLLGSSSTAFPIWVPS